MNMARLSIVIPSYRRVDYLAYCLQSVVLNQPAGTEIIVVDDGSKNGIVSATAKNYPNVKIIRNEKSRGFAAAANRGIFQSTGKVVELLNDDAEVTAGWAEPAVKQFENPEVVAVAPLVLIHPNNHNSSIPKIDSAGDEYDCGGFARKRFHGEYLQEKHLMPEPVWGVSAAAGFYRRESLLKVGGFAEYFGAYFEDVDLSRRLKEDDGQIVYEPRSIVWHRVSSSYGRNPSRKTLIQQSRNEERLFWRSSQGENRWRYVPRHAAVLAGKSMRRLSEGTFTSWLTGRVKAVIA